MAEQFTVDTSLSWAEHYVQHGFGIIPGLLSKTFCRTAVAEVGRIIGDNRSPEEWTVTRPGKIYSVLYAGESAILDEIFEHPSLTEALAHMFGPYGFHFDDGTSKSGRIHFALWVNPFDPDSSGALAPLGHVDSGSPYRGLALQVALSQTEPRGGNTTFFADTHRLLHRHLLAAAADEYPGGAFFEIPRPYAPWEFVAQAGDVALIHHLLCHSANPAAAASRRPRIALRIEVFPRVPIERVNDGAEGPAWARGYGACGEISIRKGIGQLIASAPNAATQETTAH